MGKRGPKPATAPRENVRRAYEHLANGGRYEDAAEIAGVSRITLRKAFAKWDLDWRAEYDRRVYELYTGGVKYDDMWQHGISLEKSYEVLQDAVLRERTRRGVSTADVRHAHLGSICADAVRDYADDETLTIGAAAQKHELGYMRLKAALKRAGVEIRKPNKRVPSVRKAQMLDMRLAGAKFGVSASTVQAHCSTERRRRGISGQRTGYSWKGTLRYGKGTN